MTAEEIKLLDDKRREREDELVFLLLLLLGYGVSRALADSESSVASLQRPAGNGTTQDTGTPSAGNRASAASLASLGSILRTQGVAEIAGSMADAHLDAFEVYEPSADSAPSRDSLVADYTPSADEMVTAIIEAIQQANGATLAESILKAKYSRSDSTGLELGAERQIVTASNAGLIGGAIVRQNGPRLEGFRHVSVIDDRTSKQCQERDGLMLAARDHYWQDNWPSLHFRCRSVIAPIFGPFKASQWRPRTPPEIGFGRMPTSVRRMLKRLAA